MSQVQPADSLQEAVVSCLMSLVMAPMEWVSALYTPGNASELQFRVTTTGFSASSSGLRLSDRFATTLRPGDFAPVPRPYA